MFGMLQVGRRLRLSVEPLDVAVGSQLPGENHFEGDDAVRG